MVADNVDTGAAAVRELRERVLELEFYLYLRAFRAHEIRKPLDRANMWIILVVDELWGPT